MPGQQHGGALTSKKVSAALVDPVLFRGAKGPATLCYQGHGRTSPSKDYTGRFASPIKQGLWNLYQARIKVTKKIAATKIKKAKAMAVTKQKTLAMESKKVRRDARRHANKVGESARVQELRPRKLEKCDI